MSKKLGGFTGDLGDALLIDSFRVYHRGGKCKKIIELCSEFLIRHQILAEF